MLHRQEKNFRFAASVMVPLALVVAVLLENPVHCVAQTVSYQQQVLPVLTKYCVDCHSGTEPEGGFTLDGLKDDASAAKAGEAWRKVHEMVDSGTMPPEDPKPSQQELDSLLGWIRTNARAECEGSTHPGRVTVRRLNRIEYNNTVRDLLGIDARPADDFPADDVGYGFDNIGDVLTISPIHTEKYLAAAESLAKQAIVAPQAVNLAFDAAQLEGGSLAGESGRGLPSTGEVGCTIQVETLGEYELTAVAFGQQAGDEPVRMEFRVDDKAIQTVDVPAERDKPGTYAIPVKLIGKHRISVKFLNDYYNPDAPDPNQRDRNMYVVSLAVRGPVAVPGAKVSDSQRELIFCHPGDGKLSAKECAEKILHRFGTRAYRRPLQRDELRRLVGLASLAWQQGESFERGIQFAVQAILSSPHFLLKVERDAPNEMGTARRIDEYSLASRLSYFLWSTMPDEKLFELASKRKLRDNLEPQVRRMLADPKSKALVENFASQWLHTRNLLEATPDKKVFPDFDEKLRLAMKSETELFFESIMREDKSILEFLSSDYTFLNESLARHYGIKGIQGDALRKVVLEGDAAKERGGLLTQASILTVTSNPNRTSPVKRGKWILEQILGTPPPPPPPNVEVLNEEKAASESASLRDRLEAHRAKPECATCHDRMDPLGFALENYNAVGGWREQDGRFPVDSSATLPDGRSFAGPGEMKQLLRDRPERFVRCITEKLLTYAVGRGMEYSDHCAVDGIAESLPKSHYRFSGLVLGIVTSDPFQLRETEETP